MILANGQGLRLTSKTALEIIKQVGTRVLHAAQRLHLFLRSPGSAQRWVHPPQSSTSVSRKAALRLAAARPSPVPEAPATRLPTRAASQSCAVLGRPYRLTSSPRKVPARCHSEMKQRHPAAAAGRMAPGWRGGRGRTLRDPGGLNR